jgi:DNA-binding XRE family transcriptional regulator
MKNKPGPKTWMPTPQSFIDMEAYAARGLTMEQIAGCLGISYQTLNERSKEIPEISESIKRGQSVGIAEISNALYEGAKAGNTTAQIFFMKCRAHWKETSVNEVSIVAHEVALKELE